MEQFPQSNNQSPERSTDQERLKNINERISELEKIPEDRRDPMVQKELLSLYNEREGVKETVVFIKEIDGIMKNLDLSFGSEDEQSESAE